ncbi:MAG: CNNM domain-containing protein, partial [Flammeovirgaceae bacterium]|nr:CNNM domain-containing protein [Flammeovirgaceae bacterium]
METASSETSSTIFSFFTILQNISASFYPVLITSGILLIFSGLISGSEVAFFSLTPAQLKACSESQSSTERQIVVLLKKPKLLLACILILNNTVNTAIVTICTFAMWEIYGKDNNLAVVVLTFIITVVILFFGEILPKIFATRSNIMFARNMVRVWLFLTTVLAPLATSLTIIGDWVERKYKKKGYKVTADELNVAVEMTIGHETTEKEKEILKGIVNFGSKSVRQIMQVRVDIFAVNKKIDFHELMDKINKNAYSRIPVFEETLDKIIGIIYVKDLLPYINESENFD